MRRDRAGTRRSSSPLFSRRSWRSRCPGAEAHDAERAAAAPWRRTAAHRGSLLVRRIVWRDIGEADRQPAPILLLHHIRPEGGTGLALRGHLRGRDLDHRDGGAEEPDLFDHRLALTVA